MARDLKANLEATRKQVEEKTKALEDVTKARDEVRHGGNLAELSTALSEAKRQKLRLEEELHELETILKNTRRSLKITVNCKECSADERRLAKLALKQSSTRRDE
jgi:septal ring factor EnvC (AmiA/AmiB activator)